MTRISCKVPNLKRIGAAALAALFACDIATAEPVNLRTEGGLAISGDVLSFDGDYMRLRTEYGVVTVAYAGVICEGLRCPAPSGAAELRFAGSPRIGEVLLPALVEAYGRQRNLNISALEGESALQYQIGPLGAPELQVYFALNESSVGFEMQRNGTADVVMSARPATAAENTASMAAGLGALNANGRARILALDALVPVVSPLQPVKSISLDALSSVFSGDVTNWSDLKGEDGVIHPVLAAENSDQAHGFQSMVLGDSAAVEDAVRIEVGPDMTNLVAEDPLAIGVVPMGAFGKAAPMILQDVCGLRSIPRRTSLKTGDYPLTMPLYLYLPEYRIAPQAADFLAWLRSNEAQAVIRRAGFVDQGVVPIGWDEQGERLANAILQAGSEVSLTELQEMLRTLDGQARLSTTFRFAEGATTLTPVSESHLLFLAQAIRDGQFDGRRLTLAGFSDGTGAASINKNLSQTRADAVLAELTAALGGEVPEAVRISANGFGEALPMGCDETEWGRRMNRRVELWVGD